MLDEWLFTPILSSFESSTTTCVVDAQLSGQLVDPDLLRGQNAVRSSSLLAAVTQCRAKLVELGAR